MADKKNKMKRVWVETPDKSDSGRHEVHWTTTGDFEDSPRTRFSNFPEARSYAMMLGKKLKCETIIPSYRGEKQEIIRYDKPQQSKPKPASRKKMTISPRKQRISPKVPKLN